MSWSQLSAAQGERYNHKGARADDELDLGGCCFHACELGKASHETFCMRHAQPQPPKTAVLVPLPRGEEARRTLREKEGWRGDLDMETMSLGAP